MIRPVTVGVDGSPESLAALDWAAQEAHLRGVPLHLLHSWPWQPPPSASAAANTAERHWAGRLLREAQERVDRVHPGLDVTVTQVPEPPTAALLDAARTSELLALGSRGLSGLTGFLTGAVAQSVLATAERPVVLVRAVVPDGSPEPGGVDRGTAQDPHREVVVGVELGRSSHEVIEFAFEEARIRKAVLHVVHTYRIPQSYGFDSTEFMPLTDADLVADNQRELAELVQPWREKWPDFPVTEMVVGGNAAEQLLRTAHGAELLVVGRRRRATHLGPHTGPVTHAVIHHAQCPVAVVPHS
ncbi:universal stress protein [Streptomyces beijiangensis]|uniref:Universal stress protein n=1 Tax=Streptomyces beijiangensis TaxID=163361 RepID=A0A939JIL3_9ACTN|nr:universal stress protein [Streptomyces beijiangensis]MBO0513305.1 universal stress protein [Streptomyces beijiangensis]